MTRIIVELPYYAASYGQKVLELASKNGRYWKRIQSNPVKVSDKFDKLVNKKNLELDLMDYFKSLGYNFLVELRLCDHYDQWCDAIEIVGEPLQLAHFKMKYQF